MRPRDPVATAPASASQLTALSILGVDPRRYLDMVRERRIPHARAGKLVIVAVADWLDALASMRSEPSEEPSDEHDAADEGEQTADQILALVGRRRA